MKIVSVLTLLSSLVVVSSSSGETILSPFVYASYSFRAFDLDHGTRLFQQADFDRRSRNAVIDGRGDVSATDVEASWTGGAFSRGLWSNGAAASVNYEIEGGLDVLLQSRADAISLSFIQFDYEPWRGRSGYFDLGFAVSGEIAGDSADLRQAALGLDSGHAVPLTDDLFGDWSIEFISGEDCLLCQTRIFPGSTDTFVSFRIPMIWGEWTAIWLAMVASIAQRGDDEGFINVDFLHTVSAISFDAFDLDGHRAPESRMTVVANDRVVPEPPLLALLLSGAAALKVRSSRLAAVKVKSRALSNQS